MTGLANGGHQFVVSSPGDTVYVWDRAAKRTRARYGARDTVWRCLDCHTFTTTTAIRERRVAPCTGRHRALTA